MSSNDLPRSLPLLLQHRSEGRCHRYASGRFGPVVNLFKQQFAQKSLVRETQIVTPQRNFRSNSSIGISSIHVDRVENRFLLAGGDDATVSVYDLSKRGSEQYLNRPKNTISEYSTKWNYQEGSIHKPIARSLREPPQVFSSEATNIEIPAGHSAPISKVQWYTVDSGAFLSSAKDGALLIWDTDSLSPVALCRPFGTKPINNFHLSPLRDYSTVVASLHDSSIKLVDIRTGASSHTLLGHSQQGVSSVQWAPCSDVILASGGLDGTVRLWDIRKAGSRSCVVIMNQDVTQPPSVAKACKADYSHLPKPSSGLDIIDTTVATDTSLLNARRLHRKKKIVTTTSTANAAPNNYRPTESTSIVSHGGAVSAVSFTADGQHLVSTGQDGNLHIWDLRSSNAFHLPLRFLGPGQQPVVSRQKKQVPMLLIPEKSSLGQCWVANGTSLYSFSLDQGGTPRQVLDGHLHNITAIDTIEASLQLLTAGKDGMILTWGKHRQQERKRKVDDRDSW